MGRRPTGTVEARGASIRLKFTWRGRRCVEVLDLEPTPANIKAAERLMAKIQGAIDAGVYERTAYFTAREGEALSATFKDFGEDWLKTLTKAKSTRRSYRSGLNSTWYPAFGDKRLTEIKHSDVAKAVAAKVASGASGKTVNNVLIPLRKVFEAAGLDDLVIKNPADGIKNQKHQRTEPDPFELAELHAVLAHLRKAFDPQVANYFDMAFNTGIRPSELIAIRWADVDWSRRRVRIDKARVDWEEKVTKSFKVRDVDLNDAAIATLKRQKEHTFLADAEVFHNPITAKAWADEQVQRRRYWNPTLRALGMRQRDAYQCRHTYASILLMGGVNPAYIAKQLGHAKITTTLNVYARWIEGADKGAEAKKANAVLGQLPGQLKGAAGN